MPSEGSASDGARRNLRIPEREGDHLEAEASDASSLWVDGSTNPDLNWPKKRVTLSGDFESEFYGAGERQREFRGAPWGTCAPKCNLNTKAGGITIDTVDLGNRNSGAAQPERGFAGRRCRCWATPPTNSPRGPIRSEQDSSNLKAIGQRRESKLILSCGAQAGPGWNFIFLNLRWPCHTADLFFDSARPRSCKQKLRMKRMASHANLWQPDPPHVKHDRVRDEDRPDSALGSVVKQQG